MEEVVEVTEVTEVTEEAYDFILPSMPDNNIPHFQDALKMNHILDFDEESERIEENKPQQLYNLGFIQDDE